MATSEAANTRLASRLPPTNASVTMTRAANAMTSSANMRVRAISWTCSVSRGVMTEVTREPSDTAEGSSLERPLARSSLRDEAAGSATVAGSSTPGLVAGSVPTPRG